MLNLGAASHFASFGRGQRTLIIEDLPERKPTGWQSLLIPLKPRAPGSAWLHFNVFLMCLSIAAVDTSLQKSHTRHRASWARRVIHAPWNLSFSWTTWRGSPCFKTQRYFRVGPFHLAHCPSSPDWRVYLCGVSVGDCVLTRWRRWSFPLLYEQSKSFSSSILRLLFSYLWSTE